jgi:glucosamine--fructose-6-phosphate aminotransferase (isomerizing)
VIADEDTCLIGVRNGSPLVAGYAGDDVYIASDPLSFADQTRQVSFIEDRQLVEYRNGRITFYDIDSGASITPPVNDLVFNDTEVVLNGYEHFMIKEILEQPQVIAQAGRIDQADLQTLADAIGQAAKVITVGAGGAYFAAQQIAGFLQTLAAIDARSIAAYEMSGDGGFIGHVDVVIAVSQSGETADTIDAVRLAKQRGARIASIVNMPGSTLSRLSDYPFYNNAGPEICVLSTKSSAAQMTFGYILANYLSGQQTMAGTRLQALQTALTCYLSRLLLDQIKTIAQHLHHSRHLFVLGKGAYRVSARIGALNIKEASYIHAEAFAAGELKHGVIALIEQDTPVIVFVDGQNRHAMLNAAAEVKSRGALVIGIADQPNELFDAYIALPEVADQCRIIGSIIPCQLLAYFLSTLNGHNPDRPRNLAKSVTVR